jgi:hypothetical protein
MRHLLEDPKPREARHLPERGRFLRGKGSPDGSFNAPALLPGEADGRRAFPVKPHYYRGGVLSDDTATGIEGASPPRSRRVVWR